MILQNKFKEAQTHLRVTPEMRKRLLQSVQAESEKAAKKPTPRFDKRFLRVAVLAACAVLAVAAVRLLPSLTAPDPVLPGTSDSTSVSAVPLTPEDVQENLDFTLFAPSTLPQGYVLSDYTGTKHAARLSYTCGGAEITYAMSVRVSYPDAVGSPDEEDLHILPTDRPESTTGTVGDKFVTLYGKTDAYLYAEWYGTDTDYQLAFSAPRSESEITALIESVKPCK